MLNPIAVRPVETGDEIQRSVFCPHYEKCLDYAISQDWENFTCAACGLFEPRKSITGWLEQNTFLCKLGRLTPEQCKINRSRKRLTEPLSFNDRSPEARARLAGIVMPTACESCTDWKDLIAQHRRKRKSIEKKSSKPEEGRVPIAAESTKQTCVCKECKGTFEPYKHGATVVKTICATCLTAKIFRKKKDSGSQAAEPAQTVANSRYCNGSITLVFADADGELLRRINDISRRERRSVDSQILYWLENYIPELKAKG